MLMLALAFFQPSLALADDTLTVTPDVWVRPRLEAHTGRDGTSGTTWVGFSHRARLGFKLTQGDLSIHVQAQDVRVWGEETHTLKDYSADGLDMHQAYVRWQASEKLWLKAGRQEVNIHEQRMIGAVGWTQQGRPFDGLTLGSKGEIWDADGGAFVLTEGSLTGATGDVNMAYGRAGWTPENGRVDGLFIWEHNRPTDLDRFTAGVYAKGKRGDLEGRIEAYGQVGSSGSDSIRAAMVGLTGSYTLPVEQKLKVALWADWLSGDKDATDGVITTFSPTYATNHKFYGFADIVGFSQGAWADGSGLVDTALRLSVKPTAKTMVAIDAHTFMRPSGDDSGFLAEEIDVWGKVQLTPGLNLWLGGAVWFPGGGAEPDLWTVAQIDARL